MAAKRHSIWRTESGGLSLGYSGMSLYWTCPRKFYWSYVHGGTGIEPQAEEWSPALQYGKLWHHLWKTAAIQQLPLSHGFEEWCNLEGYDQREHHIATLFKAVAADLDWYFQQTEAVKIHPLFAEEELRAEVKSDRTGLTHTLRGTPDLIAELDGDWGGGVYIVDHKTYSVISKDNRLYVEPSAGALTRQAHSTQFPAYMALWNLVSERPIYDGLVNFVPQQASEVLRIQSSRKGNQKPLKVHREFIFSNPDRCANQLRRWVAACDDIVLALETGDPEAWFSSRENNSACVNGHGRVCQFASLCENSREVQTDLLEGCWKERELR